MMIGNYPCCNGSLMIELPDVPLPRLAPEQCPHCGATVWHYLSRVDPKSWTEAQFLEAFDVDEETKTVTPKPRLPTA